MSTTTIDITTDTSSGDDGVMGARIAIICVMLISGSFVFLPFTKKCAHNEKESKTSCKNLFFAISACFAAGMLMSISILHILPEANEMYEKVVAVREAEEKAKEALEAATHGETAGDHDKHDEHAGEGGHSFPLPFFIFQAGFFLMLTMNLIFHSDDSKEGEIPGDAQGHEDGNKQEEEIGDDNADPKKEVQNNNSRQITADEQHEGGSEVKKIIPE